MRKDVPRGTFGKVPLGTPQNFLGQIQRACLWRAFVRGIFIGVCGKGFL
jgi:hypothetical protein